MVRGITKILTFVICMLICVQNFRENNTEALVKDPISPRVTEQPGTEQIQILYSAADNAFLEMETVL